MKASGILRDDGACGYYRVRLPLEYCSRLDDDFKCEIIQKGDSDETVALKLDSDVVLIPRPNSEKMYGIIKKLNELGKKTVVDFDDNVFNLSPFSPHYGEHGLEKHEKYMMPDGRTIAIWPELDIKGNRERLDWTKRSMEIADLTTVTTDILAGYYKEHTDRIKPLPNCVDLRLFKRPQFADDGMIRLCWHGGFSHYEDLYLLEQILDVVMRKYQNTVFITYGFDWAWITRKCPKERLEHHPWVQTVAHPYYLSLLNVDIGIIPLAENEFNSCKSAIKWIEYAALGKPCVTSYVSPYKEVYDGKNGVFVENDPDAWIRGISELIEDALLRADMGRRARETVERDWSIQTQWPRWVNTYMGLLN